MILEGGPRAVVVSPGQHFSLDCRAAGSPPPSIEWFVDGESLAHAGVDGLLVATGSVSGDASAASTLSAASGASPAHAGWYSCVAVNALGKDDKTSRVDVVGPPRAARPMRDLAALAGTTFLLHCPYGGYPIDEIAWTKNGN